MDSWIQRYYNTCAITTTIPILVPIATATPFPIAIPISIPFPSPIFVPIPTPIPIPIPSELGADAEAASLLEQHAPLLMEGYLRRVQSSVREWVGKIMQQDWREEAVQEDTGHFVTSAPQDLFCMLNQQLDVAFKRDLPPTVLGAYTTVNGSVVPDPDQAKVTALEPLVEQTEQS